MWRLARRWDCDHAGHTTDIPVYLYMLHIHVLPSELIYMEGIILIVLIERPRSHRPSVVQVAILFFYLNGCSISVAFNGLSRSGIANCTLWAISTYIPWMRLLQHVTVYYLVILALRFRLWRHLFAAKCQALEIGASTDSLNDYINGRCGGNAHPCT